MDTRQRRPLLHTTPQLEGFRASERQPLPALGIYLATVLCVVVGLITAGIEAAEAHSITFHASWERVLNNLAFFTDQSNIIVGVTVGVLLVKQTSHSKTFWVFRYIGIVAIIVTALVYHIELDPGIAGFDTVTGLTLHTLVPVLAVIGWIWFGPRGRVSAGIAWLSILYPLLWLAGTLIRGKAIGWYPYGFVNVTLHGYRTVAINCCIIALGIGLLTYMGFLVDRWLTRKKITAFET
jgi:hypothetical protein